jgi:hypothetical protein
VSSYVFGDVSELRMEQTGEIPGERKKENPPFLDLRTVILVRSKDMQIVKRHTSAILKSGCGVALKLDVLTLDILKWMC